MPQPGICKIYAKLLSSLKPVTKKTPFSFHFALLSQSYTTASFGEQSIWTITDNKANETTIFIKILDKGNTPMSSRYKRFKTLQRESLYREISDYTCVVFYNHWIKQDLENVADPRLGVHTLDVRAAVARAFGLDVRLALGDFLNKVEEGVMI
ncbi:hypothetical protein B0J14DRAFT_587683 [Halenospora varia]|nr:hypothetical protein B0J14DRAFT_587683 [Halenospora varia]